MSDLCKLFNDSIFYSFCCPSSLGDVRMTPKAVFLELGMLGSDGVFLQKLLGSGTAFIQGGMGPTQAEPGCILPHVDTTKSRHIAR